MLPILQIGHLALQFPGLVLLLGVWLGLALAEKWSYRQGIAGETLYNLVFAALAAGIIGARLSYAAQYRTAFTANPLSLISLNPGLFDPTGGLVAGVLAALIVGQRKGLALRPTLDALTPLFAVFLLAVPLSQLASGAAFGMETDLPWAILLWGAPRHPTQLYAALLAALGLFLFWPGRPRLSTWTAGQTFLAFTVYSGAARLFIEAFRGDSIVLAGGFRAPQLAAWCLMAAGLWLLHKNHTQA